MGEVYEGRDTRLGRPVALKVIRAELLKLDTGAQRFEREARLLASLNHPRIAAIHGFEESDGTRFLVLEYVPGPTMAERLERGPLSVREAMLVGQQIAEALEAAHTRGIIHRDLKPANIKLSDGGQVKVLDFGLAKSIEPRPGACDDDPSATMTQDLTREMTVLGTAAYMSPEQACGKELDSRTDIWSFGCVLYEALTARQAFRGATATEIVAAVLEREPDWQALPAATPPAVQLLLKRCLRKDPNSRLRNIGDARIELEDALAAPAQERPGRNQGAITRRTAIGALGGAVAGAAATGVFAVRRYRDATPRNLTRFSIGLPEGGVAEASGNRRVAISRDGTHIAYNISLAGLGQSIDSQKFYHRSLSELEPRLLSAPGGAPFFSPDGHWLGFAGPGPGGSQQVRKVGLSGGAPVTLCPTEAISGATWADDDTVYFVGSNPGSLMRIPAAGGQPQEAAKIDFAKGERLHKYPCAIFGSKVVLFTSSTAEAETYDDTRIGAIDTRTGQRKILAEGGTHPRYSPSGHLVYARGGNLLAVRFDPDRLVVTGQPFTVLEGVVMSVNSGVANFDISANGDLIYLPGGSDKGERSLVWVDREGRAEPLPPLPAKSYLHPRISPDDRHLAVEVEGPNHDFYVYDFARGVLSKLTTDGESHWPVWSPDGSHLVYRAGHMLGWRMWQMPADRSGDPKPVPGTGVSQSAESWSPDGHAIAYTATTGEPGAHIMVASVEGGQQSRAFADIKAPAGSPKFSPDGRWLAYCSNESGKPQVYVQAYPGPGAKIQVSSDGGTDPVWKRNGGELYYRDGDKMMAVAVSTAPTFSAGRPQMLWQAHYSHGMSASCGPPGATSSNYDVTADGKRFLMIKDNAPDTAFSKQIVVVLGWSDEMSRIERSKEGKV